MDEKVISLPQKAELEKRKAKTIHIHPFPCIKCKKSFLKYRFDKMTTTCTECQARLKKKSDTNVITHENKKKKQKCESCSVTFKSKYVLRKHFALKETFLKNQCKDCNKSFSSKENYSNHIVKHIDKNVIYKCEMCPLKFKLKRSLKSHLVRIHKTEENKKQSSQVKLKYFYYY